jgi:hypothetical protein
MSNNTTIKLRRGLSSEWLDIDPVLASGEPGFEIDTGKLKIGDGNNNWTSLNYLSGSGETNYGNGNYGMSWDDIDDIPLSILGLSDISSTQTGDIIIASGNNLYTTLNLDNSIQSVVDTNLNTSLNAGAGINFVSSSGSLTLSVDIDSINFSSLPSGDPLVAGKLWQSDGFVKISTGS